MRARGSSGLSILCPAVRPTDIGTDRAARMKRWIALLKPRYARWCGYLLLLLAPGSFVLLPALGLIRLLRSAQGRPPSASRPKAHSDALPP